jgi:hypothetical protein
LNKEKRKFIVVEREGGREREIENEYKTVTERERMIEEICTEAIVGCYNEIDMVIDINRICECVREKYEQNSYRKTERMIAEI